MSGAADSSYPADWLEVARRDWRRVHMLLSAGDTELAAYLLEQCLEKYLKAYILDGEMVHRAGAERGASARGCQHTHDG